MDETIFIYLFIVISMYAMYIGYILKRIMAIGMYRYLGETESKHSGGPCRKTPPVSPRNDTVSTDTIDNTILRFGKYRGRSISDIYETDPSYCRWLQPQEILIGEYPEIKAYIDGKFKNTDQSYLMTWDKYRGRSIRWIRANDEGYFQWLLSNEFVNTNCKTLTAELLSLAETK